MGVMIQYIWRASVLTIAMATFISFLAFVGRDGLWSSGYSILHWALSCSIDATPTTDGFMNNLQNAMMQLTQKLGYNLTQPAVCSAAGISVLPWEFQRSLEETKTNSWPPWSSVIYLWQANQQNFPQIAPKWLPCWVCWKKGQPDGPCLSLRATNQCWTIIKTSCKDWEFPLMIS